jgi:hypothetical protein
LRHFGGLDHLAGPDGVAAALLAAEGGFGTADASRIFHVPPSRTSTPGCRVGRDRRGTEDDAAARNSPKGWRYWFALALFLGLAFEEIYDALAALNVLL